MGKYIKLFDTNSDYEAYMDTPTKTRPNVCVSKDKPNEAHFNPWIDTRLVAKFNVTDTINATYIMGTFNASTFTEIEIDGVVQPSVVTSYTFSTTGEHTVKYKLAEQTTIGYRAFYGCARLTNIVIPDTVTVISEGAFAYCSILNNVNIPDSVITIGQQAFIGCSGLNVFSFGKKVDYIGNRAFSECEVLEQIILPETLTVIGYDAFGACGHLYKIAIPSNVRNIGGGAFGYCTSLQYAEVYPETPPTLGSEVFYNTASNFKIYVPSASLSAYQGATNWSAYGPALTPMED